MAQKFGKFELDKQLAIGGMAEVFLARQTGPAGFSKTLCLKRILPRLASDTTFVEMFLDEARTVALLNHPNIVQIYELGEIDGSYYIAMEYIRGASLSKLLRRLRERDLEIPLHYAAKIIADVCAGLEYAHHFTDAEGRPLNLVHRDISPDNVLVSVAGNVKTIDFGIAKAVTNTSKTQAGAVKGKFSYMSPEQIKGQPLDGRSDLFSLGIVFYELVTKKKPFGDDADLMTVSAIVHDAPRSPREIVQDFPAELEAILEKALAKEPAQRYQSAAELHRDLDLFMRERGDFLSSRDLGNYVQRLLSDDPADLETLKRLGSAVEMKLTGAAHGPGEPPTAIGTPPPALSKAGATASIRELAPPVGSTPRPADANRGGPTERPERVAEPTPVRPRTATARTQLGGPPGAMRPPPGRGPEPIVIPNASPARGQRWLLLALIAVVVGAAGYGGFMLWQRLAAPSAPSEPAPQGTAAGSASPLAVAPASPNEEGGGAGAPGAADPAPPAGVGSEQPSDATPSPRPELASAANPAPPEAAPEPGAAEIANPATEAASEPQAEAPSDPTESGQVRPDATIAGSDAPPPPSDPAPGESSATALEPPVPVAADPEPLDEPQTGSAEEEPDRDGVPEVDPVGDGLVMPHRPELIAELLAAGGEAEAPSTTLEAHRALALRNAGKGVLRVSTQPRMTVVINGQRAGESPGDFELYAGTVRLELRGDNGATRSSRPKVTAGEVTLVRETLDAGLLHLGRLDPGQEVFIDGRRAGRTPLDPIPLWEGDYSVKVKHPDGRVKKQTVRVSRRSRNHHLTVRW